MRRKQSTAGIEKVKARVRQRDGRRCTKCGITEREHVRRHNRGLHVHRIVPGSLYSLEGCVTLCISCHGPQPKRPPGTGDDIVIRAYPALKEALHAYAKHDRRSASKAGALLLEEILKAKGFFPPPPLEDQP
jgi:5-methylcytosine-specific restriction endonuclease McrA